jgi:DNA polymerase III subunit delta'
LISPASRIGDLIVGQPRAADFLERWSSADQLPPLLFTGPAGVGKRTAALVCAQSLNCTGDSERPCGICRNCTGIAQLAHPDVVLLFPIRIAKKDPEPEDATDATMRRYPEYALALPQSEPDRKYVIPLASIHWLRREIAKAPALGQRRLFVILHAHQMNREASNALLKMLEEPQRQTTFILTSDNPGFLLETIRSRCQTVRFSPLSTTAVADWLEEHAEAARADAELAAAVSGGSLGGALRFLQNRETFLSEPVVDYFAGRAGTDERAVLETLERVKGTSSATVVSTLLFLHREALDAVTGRGSVYARSRPADMQRALAADIGYLRRAIRFLLERSREVGTNVSDRLFTFTLLTMLRPPGTQSSAIRISRAPRPDTDQRP